MAQGRPLLLLFDGHALVHRAFHALPPLSVTRTGEPTGAAYGFVSMLLKALRDLKPDYWAIAFDSPAPTFRHERFKEYKAQRPPAPDDLKVQFRRVRELVEAFGMPAFEVEGYEADDVLGALARQASDGGLETIIVTGDTDTLQLVAEHVQVLVPKAGRPFSDTILYDEEAVRSRYGLEPPQIADLKGLKGDPSDNIPGVPGVGEKTATRLLQQFGSVEGIYEGLEEVTPAKVQETLRTYEEVARQSKELATIVTDVPVQADFSSCAVAGYDRDRVTELFRELEFTTLLGKLPEMAGGQPAPGPQPAAVATEYRIVNSAEGLEEALAVLSEAERFAIDLETTGKDARSAALVGIALSTRPGRAWYLPVGHWMADQLPLELALSRLRPVLEDERVPKIAHNGKYDATVLLRYGVKLKSLACDTMVAAHLLGEKSLGLKALAFAKLSIEMMPITDLIGTGPRQASMAQVPIQAAAEYACADADMTGRLSQHLEAELREQGLWPVFVEVEMPLLPVLLRMEQNGVALDTARLREMSQGLGQEMARLEGEVYQVVGHQFNINSTRQLAQVLYEELGLPRPRKTKTGYSTEAAVLEALRGQHPVIERLLDYRQLSKLKSTYIDALPVLIDPADGRVHTSFNQTGTATGRLSSSDPNLQNIPVRTELGKAVRRAFVAPSDNSLLLGADYSQIELRVLAHFSQDPGLLSAFAQDEDIHAATASQVFGVPIGGVTPDMRRVAKVVNFGVFYGISEFGLEQATGLSRQEAGRFMAAYFEKYAGVKDYIAATKKKALEQGYVHTLLGRRRYIPEIASSNQQVRQGAERMAINMPVQGTAADIIKKAMVALQRELERGGLRTRMILQVHDELLFEVPLEELKEVESLVLKIMPHALELSVPLKVDLKTGRSWGGMD